MTLVSKAWRINTSNFSEPWFAPDGVYYAQTPGQAKMKALSDACGFMDKDFNEITFLTLRMVRAKKADKYQVGDKVRTLRDILYEKDVAAFNAKIDETVANNPNAFAYIKKGGSYYCSNYCGYTEAVSRAGIYPIKDAAAAVKGCSLSDYMRLIVIDKEQHNIIIQNRINELTAKLITL